jgi:hypothetical protein
VALPRCATERPQPRPVGLLHRASCLLPADPARLAWPMADAAE